MRRKVFRIIIFAVFVMLTTTTNPQAATFNDINQSGIFFKQKYSNTCTLASAVMMVRRAALASGNTNWASITEDAMMSTAWSDGLRGSFTYAGITVKMGNLPGGTANVSTLISLLAEHPEGIEIYDRGIPHAILLTDYTNGVFYAADPDPGHPSGRIPVSSAWVQVANADDYWYVSSPKVTLTDKWYQPYGCIYAGKDFYARIMLNSKYAVTVNPANNWNVENADMSDNNIRSAQYLAQYWHFIRNDDGSYRILNMYYDERPLVAVGQSSGSNVKLSTLAYNGDAGQHWFMYDPNGNGPGYYIIRNGSSQFVLNVYNQIAAAGTNLQIWNYTNSGAEHFLIEQHAPAGSSTLSVSPGSDGDDTKFTWTKASGEVKWYDLKLHKLNASGNVEDYYDAYYVSGEALDTRLPAGTYSAQIVSHSAFNSVEGNIVTFTVKEKSSGSTEINDQNSSGNNQGQSDNSKPGLTPTTSPNASDTNAKAAETKAKAINPMTVKGKVVKIKYAKLKKKTQTIKAKKAVKVTKAKGKVTYKLLGVTKKKFKKYFKVNARTGKITVKKGLKKGAYKLKISITSAGNSSYKKISKTAKVTINIT